MRNYYIFRKFVIFFLLIKATVSTLPDDENTPSSHLCVDTSNNLHTGSEPYLQSGINFHPSGKLPNNPTEELKTSLHDEYDDEYQQQHYLQQNENIDKKLNNEQLIEIISTFPSFSKTVALSKDEKDFNNNNNKDNQRFREVFTFVNEPRFLNDVKSKKIERNRIKGKHNGFDFTIPLQYRFLYDYNDNGRILPRNVKENVKRSRSDFNRNFRKRLERILQDGDNKVGSYFYSPFLMNRQMIANKDNKIGFRFNKRTQNGHSSGHHSSQFVPSISVAAMSNLGDFFNSLKNNIDFVEKGTLSEDEKELLRGDYPVNSLRREFMMNRPDSLEITEETNSEDDNTPMRPAPGTHAFLHAIRTYRPSQKIRNLVEMHPEGYKGSNFHDPNYMWIGLGK